MKKNIFSILYIIYGLLLGPVELLIIKLFVKDGGLFKTIGMIILTSIIFVFIPIIIKLVLKLFKKKFFVQNDMYKTNISAMISVAIVWITITIINTKSEGLFSIILTTILLVGTITFIHAGIIWFVYKVLYQGNVPEDKEYWDKVKREQEEFDKNFKINLKSSYITDEYGNVVGTADTVSIGDWTSKTTVKDNSGKKVKEFNTYKRDL